MGYDSLVRMSFASRLTLKQRFSSSTLEQSLVEQEWERRGPMLHGRETREVVGDSESIDRGGLSSLYRDQECTR